MLISVYRFVAATTVCLAALFALAASASAAYTFGADLSLTPSGSGAIGVSTVATVTHADGTTELGSPITGVLTSVRVRSNGLANDGIVRVLRLTDRPDASTYTFLNVYSDVPISLPADPSPEGTVTSVLTRLTVAPGDRLGLQLPADGGYTTNVNHNSAGLAKCAFTGGGHTSGTSLDYSSGSCGDYELLIQGTVEADADGDGYGDDTQDACPAESARQAAPCSADIGSSVVSSRKIGRDGSRRRVTYEIRNLGPSPATNIVLRITKPSFVGSIAVSGCTLAADKRTCTIPALAAGATQTIQITARSKRGRGRSKRRNLSLRVIALGQTDANATNNDAVYALRLKLRKR